MTYIGAFERVFFCERGSKPEVKEAICSGIVENNLDVTPLRVASVAKDLANQPRDWFNILKILA